jgi:ABC-type glycerol-3-phosphate transport system substrate-binding protein
MRGKLLPVLLMIVLALALVAIGCGGSSGAAGTPPQASPQVIHVMASGGQSNSQQLNITIIIQQ